MQPLQLKSPGWNNVCEVRVLIPGPKTANPHELLNAYISARAGQIVDAAENLLSDLIDALEAVLPPHIIVTVGGRGERVHPIHGVHVLTPSGERHPDVTGSLSARVHELIRRVLDAFVLEFCLPAPPPPAPRRQPLPPRAKDRRRRHELPPRDRPHPVQLPPHPGVGA